MSYKKTRLKLTISIPQTESPSVTSDIVSVEGQLNTSTPQITSTADYLHITQKSKSLSGTSSPHCYNFCCEPRCKAVNTTSFSGTSTVPHPHHLSQPVSPYVSRLDCAFFRPQKSSGKVLDLRVHQEASSGAIREECLEDALIQNELDNLTCVLEEEDAMGEPSELASPAPALCPTFLRTQSSYSVHQNLVTGTSCSPFMKWPCHCPFPLHRRRSVSASELHWAAGDFDVQHSLQLAADEPAPPKTGAQTTHLVLPSSTSRRPLPLSPSMPLRRVHSLRHSNQHLASTGASTFSTHRPHPYQRQLTHRHAHSHNPSVFVSHHSSCADVPFKLATNSISPGRHSPSSSSFQAKTRDISQLSKPFFSNANVPRITMCEDCAAGSQNLLTRDEDAEQEDMAGTGVSTSPPAGDHYGGGENFKKRLLLRFSTSTLVSEETATDAHFLGRKEEEDIKDQDDCDEPASHHHHHHHTILPPILLEHTVTLPQMSNTAGQDSLCGSIRSGNNSLDGIDRQIVHGCRITSTSSTKSTMSVGGGPQGMGPFDFLADGFATPLASPFGAGPSGLKGSYSCSSTMIHPPHFASFLGTACTALSGASRGTMSAMASPLGMKLAGGGPTTTGGAVPGTSHFEAPAALGRVNAGGFRFPPMLSPLWAMERAHMGPLRVTDPLCGMSHLALPTPPAYYPHSLIQPRSHPDVAQLVAESYSPASLLHEKPHHLAGAHFSAGHSSSVICPPMSGLFSPYLAPPPAPHMPALGISSSSASSLFSSFTAPSSATTAAAISHGSHTTQHPQHFVFPPPSPLLQELQHHQQLRASHPGLPSPSRLVATPVTAGCRKSLVAGRSKRRTISSSSSSSSVIHQLHHGHHHHQQQHHPHSHKPPTSPVDRTRTSAEDPGESSLTPVFDMDMEQGSSSTTGTTTLTTGSGDKSPGSSSFRCQECCRVFARSDMLARHSRLHSGQRPYQCGECGQRFSRSDHLTTHSRTHTGVKPYRCHLCPYAACRKDMVTRHIQIHMKNKRSSTSSTSQGRSGGDPGAVSPQLDPLPTSPPTEAALPLTEWPPSSSRSSVAPGQSCATTAAS